LPSLQSRYGSKEIILKNISINLDLYKEVKSLGAKDMEACMQCGNCSASCPLSKDANTFPRKIYRYLQLGMKDRLLASPEPWLCYYCGECNDDCPRGAEPAETMMAVRRWLTMQYDWTGLAKRLYTSEVWEFGALGAVALFVVLLFTFFHGPIITDHVAVNTFAPVKWVEFGDLVMAFALSAFLLSNAFRMHKFIMDGEKVPLRVYFSQAKEFLLHFATQKRWRECGNDRSRWLKHFLLVTGYLTMLTLIIFFLRWFQVDDSSWHFSSLFGYYATGVLLYATVEMIRSRMKKQENIHRYSHISDWMFLILLFATTLTGIMMHLFRLAGWPMGTYVIYVIHLSIAVPMLVIEVPFGKWSHLFYRPFAVFLAKVKEKAMVPSVVDYPKIQTAVGDELLTCMHCGTCSTVCPSGLIYDYSPRMIFRSIALDRATTVSVDDAAWNCSTCTTCDEECPRGIGIINLIKLIRNQVVDAGLLPASLKAPVSCLEKEGNPWEGKRTARVAWAKDVKVPVILQDDGKRGIKLIDRLAWVKGSMAKGAQLLAKGANITAFQQDWEKKRAHHLPLPAGAQAMGKGNIAAFQREHDIWDSKRAEGFRWPIRSKIGGKDYEDALDSFEQDKEYCLFTCCTTAYDTSPGKGSERGGHALLGLLEMAGVSYGSMGTKENCCGDMADKIGAFDLAAELKKNNTDAFLAAGVKKILTVSPHCLNTFKKDYEGLKDVEVEHYTELLDKAIANGTITPDQEVNLKVTYHDPCYLGRQNDVYDAPRRILGAIPGLVFSEMQSIRERSLCCGGGGGGAWLQDPNKETLGELRIKEALDTGSEVIATACPYCIRMLNSAITRLDVGDKIRVLDIAELVCLSIEQ
jgi:Fe-S oxidoreductase